MVRMDEALLWLYLANAVVQIVHEIDSAYWKEWELFRLPGGISGFLALHFPLIAAVLYGLVLVARNAKAGLIFSAFLCAAGIALFSIHTYLLKRGRPQFSTPMSKAVIWLALIISLIQGTVTIILATR